ncbi:unnamed protein product [Durusdinium trenchii]|uniref:Phospholipid/glycerol acyltransferase domain-containing protein n=2 Tax=Durusdinium trenchii TaxID=1381693 RepID=A0ABP0I7H4_9DINO
MVVGWIIAGYFGCGFLLHLLLWLCAWLQSLCCPRRWPDVAVQNKRKSEGGEQAIVGAGHECYEYDTPGWPPYALFKVVFAICTGLLPFRLISFVLVFCLTILTVWSGCYCKPFSCPHRICNAGFALLSRLLCNLSAVYTVQVFHKERLDWIGRPGKHPVLVPNHISMLEAFYLEYLTWGMSGCVAKSQFAIPGVRSATQFSNAVAVDTKDKDVKQKVNEGILKFVHNEPDEKGRYPCGRAFVIYPEGITNSQRGLFRFNTGAFATGMAVQPVVQRFPYKYMNPAWVSDSRISRGNDLPWMMLRYMSQFHVPMQVKICEIWEPIEAERNDAVLYASNVQNFMALQLGIAVTNTGNKILRQKGGPFDLKSSQVQPGEETPSRFTQPLLDSSPEI